MEVSSTEVQNNFGAYLRLARIEEVYITRNNKRIAVLSYCEDAADGFLHAAESKAAYSKIASKAVCPENNTKLALEDFLKLSATTDNRYELIDGEVFQLASPTYEHQRIIGEIFGRMHQWSQGKKCKPVIAPFDVTLVKDDIRSVVQPDIVVICDRDKVDEQGKYTGVPTLVVEVLLESTRNLDMVKKLNVYMTGGVREYWMVNPGNREIYIYGFASGEIKNYRVFKGSESAGSEALDGLVVPLGLVFEMD